MVNLQLGCLAQLNVCMSSDNLQPSGTHSASTHVPSAGSLTVTVSCRFMAGGSDSDSSEDDRRVILRSARDKRLGELRDSCDEIRVRAYHLAALVPVSALILGQWS